MEPVTLIFVLLIIYQIKHFLCDYLWQGPYMLGKFKDRGWVLPLLAHSSVHALATFLIVFVFTQALLLSIGLALFDLVIHFTMDRIKASPDLLGRYGIKEKQFWWSLGLDQMVHHLTHYAIIAIILF